MMTRSFVRGRLGAMLGMAALIVVLPACGSPSYHALRTFDTPSRDARWMSASAFHSIRRPHRARAVQPAAPAPGFDLRVEDQTLAGALTRWAEASGSTIRWESPLSVPITASSHVPGTLPDAMNAVMGALSRNGYPLMIAQAPEHRTWLILDASKPSTSTAGVPTP